jgi:nitrate/TMAO reductase-like tetraheme cytochrome c subunit
MPRPIGLAIAVLGLGFAGSGIYSAWRGYDYTKNDPTFCRSCHTMEEAWTRWETSEHRKVNCKSCHEASVIESARQVVTFVVRQPHQVGRHAVVPKQVCDQCHESGDPRWRQVEATAGHKIHAAQRHIECVVCHAPSIHRFKPPTEVCATCHVAQTTGERVVRIRAMADQHCTACHEFLRTDSPLRPDRRTCLECHRLTPGGASLFPANAPMQFACSQCHQPHERRQSVLTCRVCHEKPRADIHPEPVLQSTACTVCHVPHRW